MYEVSEKERKNQGSWDRIWLLHYHLARKLSLQMEPTFWVIGQSSKVKMF
jgi:hypothetical protein